MTKRTLAQFSLTDERTHESSQFRTGNWLRGRLFLFGLGFYSYRRFALIHANNGYFVSRLKKNANPRIVGERRKWRGRAISLRGSHLQEQLSKLKRKHIDVTGEFEFKRRQYGERQSSATVEFRVVGVPVTDTDDYHLYVTNLPEEFTPEQVAALYNLRWKVELVFRELKSRYGLETFETRDKAIAELLVMAALLTLTVSRAVLAVFQEIEEERWATTFRSVAQPVLADLALALGHPTPNLPELVRCEARQPEKSRFTLNKRVAQAFSPEVWP